MPSHSRLPRRMFLRGAGISLAIPFLPSLTTSPFSKAEAQSGDGLRYIQVLGQGGMAADLISPMPADHSTLVGETRLDDVTKRQGLREIWDRNGGSITPAISGARWDGLIDKMNLLSGSALSSRSNLHNTAIATFSGSYVERPGYIPPIVPFSLDWVMEQRLAQSHHAYSALRLDMRLAHGLGYRRNYDYENWSWSPEGALPVMYDIAELEAAVASVSTSPTDTGPSAADLGRVRLIDRVKDRYDALIAHPRLGRADRDRLTDAVDLLHEAEGRARGSLESTPVVACGAAPAMPDVMDGSEVNYGRLQDYASDLVAYALACEITPVASITHYQFNDYSPRNGPEGEIWHEAQHGGYSNARASEIYDEMTPWRLNRLAHLASRLDSLTDVRGGTILDHSAIFLAQEYAFQGHLHVQVGYHNIILGGAGGRLDTGNFLDLYGEPVEESGGTVYSGGCPLNRLAITLLHAMGHTTESIEGITGAVGFGEYGDTDWRQWELRDEPLFVSNTGRHRFSSDAEKRKALPILRSV